MDKYKKISIVNEYNQETKKWEIKQIVIFKEDGAPIISNFKGASHLVTFVKIMEAKGYDIMKDGLRKAINDGVINVVSKSNDKEMSLLNAEILSEQIKYQKEVKNEKSSANEKKPRIKLTKEDVELAEYFRKEILRDNGMLPPVGQKEIEELAKTNERVAALEEARKRLSEGKLSKEEFEKIHNTYREQLAAAIKNAQKEASKETTTEKTQKVEEPKEETKKIKLAKEDVELAEYFRKEILRNNGMLPPVGEKAIEELAKTNERVAALEKARELVNSNKLSKEAFQKLHDEYRLQLASAIKEASQKAEKEEVEQAKKLSKEDAELIEYFRKEILRNNGMLPPVGEKAIEELAKTNEKIKNLENAKKMVANKEISEKTYEALRNAYRAQLAESIKRNSVNVDPPKAKVSTVPPKVAPEYAKETFSRKAEPVKAKVSTVPPKVAPEYAKETFAPKVENKKEKVSTMPPKVAPEYAKETFSRKAEPVKAKVSTVPPKVAPEYAKETFAPKVENKKEKVSTMPPKVAPEYTKETVKPSEVKSNDKTKTDDDNKIKINKEKSKKPVTAVNINETKTDDEIKTVPVGKEKFTVRVKKAWKKVVATVLAAAAAVGAALGIDKLIKRNKNNSNITPTPTVTHNQNVTPAPTPTVTPTQVPVSVNAVMNKYCNEYNVPANTRAFLGQQNVLNFLSQYKNESQLREAISALCYGYEANLLIDKNGNFKVDNQGNLYLYSFTNDFLCAKAVVNNYTPEQMLAVFGNTNVTYEQIMDGFKEYWRTVRTYSTVATEKLPFRYLTNNDIDATKALNGLFDKIIDVNVNRQNGTLTSEHTDNFIVAVDELFVQNDQGLKLTEGTKTIAAAIVDGYVAVQSQVANGEALYLHTDHGYAKAGINLKEVDGHFVIESEDKTAFEFTNLFDVVNHTYADANRYNSNCLREKEILLTNINEMHKLARETESNVRINFATLLYRNGMTDYANKVLYGNYSQDLLDRIENANPTLATEIDAFQRNLATAQSEYVPFDVTTNGIDELLGIKGLKNNHIPFINKIREEALDANYTLINGKWYTDGKGYNREWSGIGSTTTTTTHVEEVDYDDLTNEEKKEADKQREELENKQEEENKRREEEARKVAQEIVNGIQNGTMSDDEAMKKASDVGLIIEPGTFDKLRDLAKNPELTDKIDKELEEKNRREQEEAQRRNEEEQRRLAEEEAKRQKEFEDLIKQGENAEIIEPTQAPTNTPAPTTAPTQAPTNTPAPTPAPTQAPTNTPAPTQDIDYSDPDRVDHDAGEKQLEDDSNVRKQSNEDELVQKINIEELDEDTEELEQPIEEDAEVKESSAKKDFYANAKAILTALDEEDLDIDEVRRNAGPVLGKKING